MVLNRSLPVRNVASPWNIGEHRVGWLYNSKDLNPAKTQSSTNIHIESISHPNDKKSNKSVHFQLQFFFLHSPFVLVGPQDTQHCEHFITPKFDALALFLVFRSIHLFTMTSFTQLEMISQVGIRQMANVSYQKVNILEVRGYYRPSKEWIVSDFGCWTCRINMHPSWYFKLPERCVANSFLAASRSSWSNCPHTATCAGEAWWYTNTSLKSGFPGSWP